MTIKIIGTNIKKIRELKNFTQEYMAERLGINQSSYARFEKEDANPTIYRLLEIAKILEINLEDLVNFNCKTIFNNYENFQSKQNSDYKESQSKEIIELLKDKIKILEQKVKN